MTETNTPSTPDTTPVAKAKRTRSEINLKYLTEYELCDRLVIEARVPERLALLSLRGWPATRIAAYETLGNRLETAALAAVGRTSARELDTEEKEAARKIMLTAIHPFRVGAKRTYRGKDQEAGRSAFHVNEPLKVSLERLLFIAGQIVLKVTPQIVVSNTGEGIITTPAEVILDGIIPEDIQNLIDRRADYVLADDEQTNTENARKQAHVDVQLLFGETRGERIDLQLAADQCYPHTAPNGANDAVRSAFEIPEDRPATE